MSEQQPTPDMQAALSSLLSQFQGVSSQPQPTGWSKPQAAPQEIVGVSIPISIELPKGKIRCYLHFGGQAASSPDALLGLLESLEAMGLPLDVWRGSGWDRGKRGWRR
jgi:hypothetical protein